LPGSAGARSESPLPRSTEYGPLKYVENE
jgi:hypothetical protein